MNIFIAGTGFTGGAIAAVLARDGHRVWGMSRRGRDAPGQVTPGQVTPGEVTPGEVTPGEVTPGEVTPGEVTPGEVTPVAGDVLLPESLRNLSLLPPMDLLVSALSGTGHKDPERYRRVYVEGPGRVADALRWSRRRRIWFLGSTGVYGGADGGGADGGWVDESTPADPLHRAGEVQLAAEAALLEYADEHCVLRLSGLYGPGRTRLIRQALRTRPYFNPDVWANQIHRDDVAGVVSALLKGEESGAISVPKLLLLSDDRPALRREIFDWVRRESGCPNGIYDEDHPARAGRSRGNKRVSNRKLRELGLPLLYPDYASGLQGVLPSSL